MVSEFRTSVDSLLAGSCIPDEIVIVVDGPIRSDLGLTLAAYERNGIIKTLNLSTNQGLGIALSAGLEICSGTLVCRFDTDDINHPARIFEIKKVFEAHPSLDIVGSYVYEFFEASYGELSVFLKSVPCGHHSIINKMNFVNPLNHPSVAFKKSSVQSLGGYNNMLFFEDYYIWLLARRAGLRFGNLHKPLVFMRRAELFSRRSGYFYAYCELKFYLTCIRRGLLNPFYVPLFIIRVLSRLLPPYLQRFQGLLPWRQPVGIGDSPLVSLWLSAEKKTNSLLLPGYPYWLGWASMQ